MNSIHPFSISSCNISVCSGMQVNNDSKENLMLNQEMIICFTMVPLSCQTVNFEEDFLEEKKLFC